MKYESQLSAHNGNAFDTYVVLNSLSKWYRRVNIVKNEKSNFFRKDSLEKIISKQIGFSNLHFRWGMTNNVTNTEK